MAAGAARMCDSGSQGGRSPRPRTRQRPPRRAEVIDLTGDDVCSESAAQDVIDLTEGEEDWPADFPASLACASPPRDPILLAIKSEGKEEPAQGCRAPWDGAQGTCAEGSFSLGSSCAHSVGSPKLSSSSSSTTFNSDLGSLASPQLDSDMFSLSPSSCSSNSSWQVAWDSCTGESHSSCQRREDLEHGPIRPTPSHSPALSGCSPSGACRSPEQPGLQPSSLGLTAANRDPPEPAGLRPVSKAWLHKLRYFRRMPVHHLFLQGVVQDEESRQNTRLKAQPIPSRKLSMVSSTMEENFPRGTLQFLMDFVSCQHHPPKEIVSHVIRNILLSSEAGQMLKDAYVLLMKIQMLHPATAALVGWDWQLLHYVMEEQEEKLPGRLLFLQYVVQTLEDDFQLNLRLRFLQKSIAKKVLSCDQCFSNVKEVIEWLVAAVTGLGFSQPQEQRHKAACPSSDSSRADDSSPGSRPNSATDDGSTFPAPLSQKQVLLLQRMLAMAAEVDMSPNCSTNKMAEVIFPYVLNIPLRSQREAFLTSMESHLLRCKVLELLFHHSCATPAALQLSPPKVLYFLRHDSPLLQYQDQEVMWQRWEEMLQHLNLLLISYHHVVLGHLRSSLSERMDLIISNTKPKVQATDRISPGDIDLHIQDFSSRLLQTLGEPLPQPIKDKVRMLQALLLTTST
ncbi:SUMO-interacting motif-containing protein 1 isoform X1 [Carettochelys insculpta]|uniref:SUMO-interacting motif-containing protein 1 isoform X1 n=1 Tax=Carettochelys insculpta TaxID=44489 RepID=UPI003EB948B2